MELRLGIVLLLCVVYSWAADDFGNDYDINLDSPASEDVKQYVFKIMSAMAAKNSSDIQVLNEKIDFQEKRIRMLELEKETNTYAIQKLQKKIVHVENKIHLKTRNCECNRKPDQQKKADKTSTAIKDTSASEEDHKTNRALNKRSPINYHSRIRRASVESRVAFFATLTPNTEHLGKDQDVVFDHAVTNIGSAYSDHHGTFIAPVAGTYVFSVTLYHQAGISSDGTWGHVVVNGAVVAKLHVNQEQSSQTIAVNLQPGDDVSIQNTETDRGFFGDRYSTFAGFLLYEDFSVGAVVG